jgi:hypothetical protein
MIRPWKVVLSVALGAALLPSSAMAQTAGPDITITNPAANATYKIGDPVVVGFQCLPKPSTTVTKCTATFANGAAATSGQSTIPTTTAGPGSLTVTAEGSDGGTSTLTNSYNVVESDDGGAGGNTPATLNITLGQPGVFAPFVPGVASDYTTTVTAQLLSTAGDAQLSVADPSATQTGHLVNGAFALAAPLQIAGSRPPQTDPNTGQTLPVPAPVFAPIGGNANPTTLLTYDGPLNEVDTITFKQPINQTESLRTGAYSKTLTFTLSTTQP